MENQQNQNGIPIANNDKNQNNNNNNSINENLIEISESPNDKIWKNTFTTLFGDLNTPVSNFLPPSFFTDSINDSNKELNSNNIIESNKELKELLRDMEELKLSKNVLENKLQNVTQELSDMKQKMQHMLQILSNYFIPTNNQNNNNNNNLENNKNNNNNNNIESNKNNSNNNNIENNKKNT